MITHTKDALKVTWSDGSEHSFHPFWLRERSFDPSNKDPATGHRLDEVALMPTDITITDALLNDDMIQITFDDGHSCTYDLPDLKHQATHQLPDDLAGNKTLWDTTLDPLPRHDGAAVLEDDAALLAAIDDIAEFGFAIVSGIGNGKDDLAKICDRIGPIRPTNWGTIADIKSMANAYDLSMTGRALEPHVDNPYRLPGPGYIFLHCLENSADGGDSFLIDGFQIAEKIKANDPGAFEILTQTSVTFRYADEDAILEHHGPLIELGPTGELHRVRFHNRADQVPALDLKVLNTYYRARKIMAEEVWSEGNTIRFRLQPGDVLIVDNYRLFHGRTEVNLATGNRHLRQCYLDRDAMSSRQKVLERTAQVAS
ncbi:MAG: gamma-butyrobetaine dioxygenase [Candidatus Azotimanducaceae bacterium]|jgi:gamma-butyrobetaine dioxygenase